MKKGKRFLALLLSFAMIVTLLPSQVALAAGDGSTERTAGTGDSTQDDGLEAGDYYIINAKTGMLLNGGNNYGSQASAFTYGQLMTLEVENSEEDTYAVNSHIQETSPKRYLGANGFLDGDKASMVIKPSANGSYTIKSSENKFLTAPGDANSTVVEFKEEETEYSRWRFLTREEYMMEAAEKVEADSSSPADVTSIILDSHTGRNNQYYTMWSGKIAASLEGNKNKYPDSQTWGKYVCVEKYKATFDNYQTIENVPNGEYELSVQGFHRVEDTNNPAAPIYYINDSEGTLKTAQSEGKVEKVDGLWTTDKGGVFVPNQMSEAAKCFETGAYSNDFISVKVTDHKIKVGLKATDNKSWVLWDNFTLRLKSLLPADEDAGYTIEKINAIGNVEYSNECKAKIDTARAYYDLLTPTQKNSVSAEQLKILTDAEKKYEDEMLKATMSPIILNGSYSFNRVHNSLNMSGSILEDSVNFTVTSSDTNVIANDGTIAAAVQTGSKATLTATLKKAEEDTVWKTFDFPVTIVKNASLTDDSITYNFDDETLQGAMPIVKGYGDYAGDVKYAEGMNYKEGNKALSLDGNYGIELPLYNPDSESAGSWSVSLWYYLEENAVTNSPILFIGDGNNEFENWIGIAGNDGNDGKWKVWHNNSTTTDKGHKTMNRMGQNAGSWNMLTLTCEKAEDKYKMTTYANGKAIEYTENYTSPSYNVLNGENQTVRVGVSYWDTPVTGLIDDVKVYTKTLSATDIETEYETQKKAEFFNKTEDERKALIQEEVGDLIPKNRKIASGIQMPTEYTYDGVKVGDLAWASDNQDVTTTDGKVESSNGAPQKAKLSAVVTYVDSKGTVTLDYNVLISVAEIAEAVKQGQAEINSSNQATAGKNITSTDAAASIAVGTTVASETGDKYSAPSTEDSLQASNYANVGGRRQGYLAFKVPAGMADMSEKELEQATLKIYITAVNANLTNNNANNKMKMGLYLVGETDPSKITGADEASFAAASLGITTDNIKVKDEDGNETGEEVENPYGKDHVVWSNEWLGKGFAGNITFDVKKLLKYVKADQEYIVFRLQVPAAQAEVQSFGAGADAAKVPELTFRYQVKLTSEEKAQEDAEELSVPQILTEDDALTLPETIGFYESNVEWTSQNSAVTLTKEENGGYKVAVNRPADADVTGTLTAKVSNGTGEDKAELTKTFPVTVENLKKYNQSLLADFSFDDDAAGLAGAGAKATKNGKKVEFVNDDEHGKVLSLSNSSYLSVANASDDDGTPLLKDKEVITVSYWSKPSTNADNQSWSFFAGRNNKGLQGNEYYLGILDRNDEVRAERYKGGRGTGGKYAGDKWKAAKEEGWHKIDVVHALGKSVIYVDGVKKSEMAFENNWTVKDILGNGNESVVYIGKANWGSGEYYTGLLDDYRIYGRALTSQEVKAVYDADLKKIEDEKQKAEEQKKVADVKANLEAPTLSAATGTISLPTEKDGCTLVWEIVEPQNSEDVKLSADGKTVTVTRGDNAITVKLQATITCGSASDTSEEYTVTVPALPKDDPETAAKREALGEAVTAAEKLIEGTTEENYPAGVWQEFRDAIDEANNAVLSGNAAALDAAKTKLEAAQAAFTSANAEDTQKVDAAIAGLTAPTFVATTGKITLSDAEGCQIAWKIVEPENSEDVKLSADGKSVEVTRGDNPITVKLQATVSSGKVSKTTDVYEITVPALPKDDPETAEKREALGEAVTAAQEKIKDTKPEDYPAGVWQALKDAIEKADEAVASGDKAALEEAEAELKEAVSAFKTNDEIAAEAEAAAKAQAVAGLNTAIAQKPANAQSYYTPESWKKYQDALTEAQNILKNPDAKSSDINAAKAALEAAFKALTAAATDPGTVTPPATDKKVTKVSLNKTKLTLGIKENFTLKATVAPADAKDKSVKWETSNKKIVSVKNGKIKGLKKGKATITVTANDGSGKKASCKVTVKPAPTKKTKISVKKSITVKVKKATTLKPKVKGNFGCATFKFTSKNKKVAKVDASGKVTGVKKGKTTITVSTYNKKAKTIVKVTVK